MNAAAVPFAQARRLSHAQLGEVLWADPLTRVHAVVMGERVAGLEERLAAAEGEYDSLWPGALTPSQRSAAPWMVRLARGSALAEWLLFQAQADFPDWGLLLVSAAPFLRLRSHLRGLGKARLTDGSIIPLPWMDPPVLSLLLDEADSSQLGELFAELSVLMLPIQDSLLASKCAVCGSSMGAVGMPL